MDRILDGVRQFRKDVYPDRKDLFKQLAGGQSPQALFITCADSRVVPDLITQSQPGDLFICRNAGNMIPSYGETQGGVSATIEYAVVALNVEDIIVCGHTDCGAMKGILHPELVAEMPSVSKWLAYGDLARAMMKENYPPMSEHDTLRALTRENVIAQLEHLHTFPCVAARLSRGKLRLHAWVYDIEKGDVHAWDSAKGAWVSIEEYTPVDVRGGLRKVSA